jgi:hypothetical protein
MDQSDNEADERCKPLGVYLTVQVTCFPEEFGLYCMYCTLRAHAKTEAVTRDGDAMNERWKSLD